MFQLKLFIVAYFKSIFAYRSEGMRWTVKHIIFLILFGPLYFILQVYNSICFVIDKIFYNDYKTIEIKKPIFIIGFPRSGTTHLHHLITKDNRFTSLMLWEMLFAPYIVQKKLFLLISRFDRRLGRPIYRSFCAIENLLFAEIRKMHYISLFSPEEDELILFHIFSSAFQAFIFPIEEMYRFTRFDAELPAPKRAQIMSFYKDSIRRHLYVFGVDKQYVSKNPAFSGKIESIYYAFPDANFVYMVRTPLEAVPSALSWMTFVMKKLHKTERYYNSDGLLKNIGHWYSYPLAKFEKIPNSSWAVKTYNELVTDPKGLVEELFNHFGFTMSMRLREVLDEANEKAKHFKSSHKYNLYDMSLTKEEVYRRFKCIFDRFGFSKY